MALIEYYPALRLVHIGTVVISGSLFLFRGVLALRGSDLRRTPVLRITPHLNDTLLLGSAVLLAVATHQSPFAQAWLAAKIIALLVYIGLGVVVMRELGSLRARQAAFGMALLVFAYIVVTAITRHPLPFLH